MLWESGRAAFTPSRPAKALKAVFEAAALPLPRIHDIDALLQGLEDKPAWT